MPRCTVDSETQQKSGRDSLHEVAHTLTLIQHSVVGQRVQHLWEGGGPVIRLHNSGSCSVQGGLNLLAWCDSIHQHSLLIRIACPGTDPGITKGDCVAPSSRLVTPNGGVVPGGGDPKIFSEMRMKWQGLYFKESV